MVRRIRSIVWRLLVGVTACLVALGLGGACWSPAADSSDDYTIQQAASRDSQNPTLRRLNLPAALRAKMCPS
jgi:hypothetical protein